MKECPECGSQKIQLIEHELTCSKCGLVIQETLFSGSRRVV